MKILSILLAILEIAFLLAGTGVVGYFMKEQRDVINDVLSKLSVDANDPYDLGEFGRFEFYLYTTSLGVIIAIISLVFAVIGMVEKKAGGLVMIAVHGLWTLQLLVSTALVAKILTMYEKETNGNSQCDSLDKAKTDHQCSHLIGGVACGFIAAILFLVDTVVYIIMSKRSTEA